jgi:hypothetical protein
MVNVWGIDELLKVRNVPPESPPPDFVIAIVPVYGPLGETVKLADAAPMAPTDGPVKAYKVALGLGLTELEAAEEALVPYTLVAVTVQVTAIPFVKPNTKMGLVALVPVLLPQVAV